MRGGERKVSSRVTGPRRIVIHRPGGHDRLSLERFEPGPRAQGQVRIAVEAIGLNYADCVARMGLYASAAKYVGWPLVPGFEVAGRVLEADPASAFAVGDEVVAVTRFGGYTTVLDVPEHQVLAKPVLGSGAQLSMATFRPVGPRSATPTSSSAGWTPPAFWAGRWRYIRPRRGGRCWRWPRIWG